MQRFIVTEFGSAMVNAIFCRPGTKLVEIIAEGQFDPWSSHFGAMNRFEHVVLFQHQSREALLPGSPARQGLGVRL